MALGHGPRVVDTMSFWEFTACMDGWRMVNGVKEQSDPFTSDELRDLGIEGFQ